MTDPIATSEAPTTNSLMDDLVEVLYAPVRVFTNRGRSGQVGGAFAVVCIAMAVILYMSRPMMQPIIDVQMRKAQAQTMAQNPQITEEQMQVGAKIGGTVATVGAMVGTPIAILILAFFVWLIGKPFGAGLTYRQGMLIGTFSFVPRLVGAIVALLLSFIHEPANLSNAAQITVGPGRFFDPTTTSATIMAVLGRLDIFVIWGTIVIAAGYIALGKLPKERAYLAAGLIWLIAGLPLIVGAMRGG